MENTSVMYRVVRLDFWDYRYPTDLTFQDEKVALSKADEMTRVAQDPLSCYTVEKELQQ